MKSPFVLSTIVPRILLSFTLVVLTASISFASSNNKGPDQPLVIMHVGSHLGGKFVTLGPKWASASLPVQFRYSANQIYPSGYDDSKFEARVNEAITVWNNLAHSNIEFAPFQVSPRVPNGIEEDDINVIQWQWISSGEDKDKLAITHIYPGDPIPEVDIVLNSFAIHQWYFDSTPPSSRNLAQVDVMDVMLHELGHVFGLDHATVSSSLMYPGYDQTTAPLRTLADGDKAGAVYLYIVGSSFSFSALPHSLVLPGPADGGYSIYYFTSNPTYIPAWKTLQLESAGRIDGNFTLGPSSTLKGASQSSSYITGTVTFSPGGTLQNLNVSGQITVNNGSSTIRNVTVNKRIALNYTTRDRIEDVTANHTDTYVLDIYHSDPEMVRLTAIATITYGIWGHSTASDGWIYFRDCTIKKKNRATYFSYSNAYIQDGTYFCQNTYDIFAVSGSQIYTNNLTWSGHPDQRTYESSGAHINWYNPVYTCGAGKVVASQWSDPTIMTAAYAMGSDPGWEDYLTALENYRLIKEELWADRDAGRVYDPQKYAAEYASVIGQFKQVSTSYPGTASSIIAVGGVTACYGELGREEDAMAYINDIVENPDFLAVRPRALSFLIPIYVHKEDFDQALDLSDEILTSSTDADLSCETLYGQGVILRYFRNDLASAAAAFRKVIADYPDHPTALSAKAELEILGESYGSDDSTSSVLDGGELVMESYPNPFNPTATIRFGLPEAGYIQLIIYDVMGHEIVRLVGNYMEAGYQRVTWNGRTIDGREVPTGLYIARLVTPKYTKSIKMLLLK